MSTNEGGHVLCEMAEHGLCDQEAENVSTIPMAGHRPKYLLCHDHLVEFGWAVDESEPFPAASSGDRPSPSPWGSDKGGER